MLANPALQKDRAMYEQAKDVGRTWTDEGAYKHLEKHPDKTEAKIYQRPG
jgi:hypothetical protein